MLAPKLKPCVSMEQSVKLELGTPRKKLVVCNVIAENHNSSREVSC